MQLQDYTGAAGAYDQAFQLYPDLEKDLRPWRMMWYQTGPYFAYFYTGRYQDLVDLATTTIEAASEPYIEESFYWRARAYEALGNRDGAIADLRTSLEYHPNFTPSTTFMQQLGISN
jgi:tetratricopeptide (TPR) repeat protein